MRAGLAPAIVAVAVILRFAVIRYRRRRAAQPATSPRDGSRNAAAATAATAATAAGPAARLAARLGERLGDVGTIAMREITERVRGRIFRVGTVLVLVAVAAAILIPTLTHGGGPSRQTIGVVGGLPAGVEHALTGAGKSDGDAVRFVSEPDLAAAQAGLRSGRLDVAIVAGAELWLNEPAASANSPADAALVQTAAQYLGVLRAYRAAGLTPAQAAAISGARAAPVHTLRPGSRRGARAPSVIGLVILFVMLSQYCTWILMGVMQEKSSRVVEVLLATVRPIQLLGGKVIGIGLVALAQAALVVGFAFALAAAVGSNLLRGTEPMALAAELCWLVLGYAFYCWAYAAAGSTAERQDQVQTLALPLSIPILIGYIFSISVATSGSVSTPFRVLAYVPPTAPFCMSVLVALGRVSWWHSWPRCC